jgi:hypothetical protein
VGALLDVVVYGYILLTGAGLLSNGSELLLEILNPGIVGGGPGFQLLVTSIPGRVLWGVRHVAHGRVWGVRHVAHGRVWGVRHVAHGRVWNVRRGTWQFVGCQACGTWQCVGCQACGTWEGVGCQACGTWQ